MKKILLFMLCFFVSTSLVYAHPPTSMDVKYDQATKQVTVIIYHQTSNPQRHFIDKVTMKVNQVAPEIKRASFQKTAKEQIAIFATPNLKPGDVIVIEAYCNKGGRLNQQVKIK